MDVAIYLPLGTIVVGQLRLEFNFSAKIKMTFSQTLAIR